MHGPMDVSADGAGAANDFSRQSLIKLYFYGEGTVSGGTIVAEEAPTEDGPWSAISGVSLTATDVTAGAGKTFPLPIQAYAWVRLNATTPVSGGGIVSCIVESMPPVW